MNANNSQALDDSPLVMPPRSRLFNLNPTGLGTPAVECLASYIHRLAAAHGGHSPHIPLSARIGELYHGIVGCVRNLRKRPADYIGPGGVVH